MPKKGTGLTRRLARHSRIRGKVSGDARRPRVAVFRSLKHIYVQVIDDGPGVTLVAASSAEAKIGGSANGKSKTEVSALVGALAAQRAVDKGLKSVVFDRGGYKYHGRVQALADAARKGGLSF